MDRRSLEHSITALEHLRAFANPLGVKILVENLRGEVTRPAHLVEILASGHFQDIGVCLDVGHAHLGDGVSAALGELKSRHPLLAPARQQRGTEMPTSGPATVPSPGTTRWPN